MKKFYLLALCFVLFGCQSQKKENAAEGKTEKIVLPDNGIPINYEGHIYFEVVFDSIKGNYLFDTGADYLYHDKFFYYNNGFKNKIYKATMGAGAGTKQEIIDVVYDTTKFVWQNRNFSAVRTPILNFKSMLGDYADGIIGYRFFNDSILLVNYEKKYVSIHQNLDSIELSLYNKIPLTKNGNRLYLPLKIRINNSLFIEGDFLLDLGSGGTITITSAAADKHEFDDKINYKIPYYTKYGGVGGESSSFNFNADSVWIGEFLFGDVKMNYSANKSGFLAGGNHIGIIGNSILDRFDIIIDFINNDLYLKPNANYNNDFLFVKYGCSLVKRDKTLGCWTVSGLYKDSNAEKSGLKIDDTIVKINDIDVKIFNEKWQEFDSLELTIRNNNQENIIKIQPENYNSLYK